MILKSYKWCYANIQLIIFDHLFSIRSHGYHVYCGVVNVVKDNPSGNHYLNSRKMFKPYLRLISVYTPA